MDLEFWTLEKCTASASSCRTIEEWRIAEYDAYLVASNKGWLRKCREVMFERWRVQDAVEAAQRFDDKVSWRKADKKSYQIAIEINCISLCTAHMVDAQTGLTLSACQSRSALYKSEMEWFENDLDSFKAAKRNYWVDLCNTNMKSSIHMAMKRGEYSYADCCEIAALHNTLTLWRSNHFTSYATAADEGWLDKCRSYLKSRRNNWHDKELIEMEIKGEKPKMTFGLESFLKKRKSQPSC
jgi:hypothetical protein